MRASACRGKAAGSDCGMVLPVAAGFGARTGTWWGSLVSSSHEGSFTEQFNPTTKELPVLGSFQSPESPMLSQAGRSGVNPRGGSVSAPGAGATAWWGELRGCITPLCLCSTSLGFVHIK